MKLGASSASTPLVPSVAALRTARLPGGSLDATFDPGPRAEVRDGDAAGLTKAMRPRNALIEPRRVHGRSRCTT